MRIVGGSLSGRRFRGPPGDATRPTSERVREAVASALDARGEIEDAVVLDLYAGTGALAFEMLSRGAASAVLVERDAKVARALDESARELGLASRVRVARVDLAAADAASRLARQGFVATLVFCDPPYVDVERAPELVVQAMAAGAIARDALVVLEHARKRPPVNLHGLASVARYEYGDTSVAFLRREAAAETGNR